MEPIRRCEQITRKSGHVRSPPTGNLPRNQLEALCTDRTHGLGRDAMLFNLEIAVAKHLDTGARAVAPAS